MTATALCFVDTETTGLDPLLHEVWEFAGIAADHDPDAGLLVVHQVVHLDVPTGLANADGTALRIGGYYGRRHQGRLPGVSRPPAHAAAEQIALAVADRNLVGVNPAFDAAFLGALLRRHGQAPAWNYHLIDLIALAAGVKQAAPPWKSTDLAETFGVTVDDDERHTALGDASWAMRWYAAIYGLQVVDA